MSILRHLESKCTLLELEAFPKSIFDSPFVNVEAPSVFLNGPSPGVRFRTSDILAGRLASAEKPKMFTLFSMSFSRSFSRNPPVTAERCRRVVFWEDRTSSLALSLRVGALGRCLAICSVHGIAWSFIDPESPR